MSEDLREGLDFYYENGFVVFTADYLRRRGVCCGSGCRHCPYRLDRDEYQRPSGRKSRSEGNQNGHP